MKLTRAQWFILSDAMNGVRSHRTYKPAIKLVELGLCKWREAKGLQKNILDITDEGDAALGEMPAPIAKIVAENEAADREGK